MFNSGPSIIKYFNACSRLFWPGAVSAILFKELKKVGSSGIGKIAEMVDEAGEKSGR